ncbi:hypothetical protein RchiOBHm_Chr0c30g0501201 [Rosa chinensis]|uniref:Uncharacterized protein n=1 Tax=Rosa chinensis TaxID=74649 RepID=A0A2P6SQD0_ROSCH|nr:hypothetical protein RchiOBHm_Chr0c30g0501201 [Rosa chinensis]
MAEPSRVGGLWAEFLAQLGLGRFEMWLIRFLWPKWPILNKKTLRRCLIIFFL